MLGFLHLSRQCLVNSIWRSSEAWKIYFFRTFLHFKQHLRRPVRTGLDIDQHLWLCISGEITFLVHLQGVTDGDRPTVTRELPVPYIFISVGRSVKLFEVLLLVALLFAFFLLHFRSLVFLYFFVVFITSHFEGRGGKTIFCRSLTHGILYLQISFSNVFFFLTYTHILRIIFVFLFL